MTIPHPYRLRAYHNPKNVDESKVPDGWRFLYADTFGVYQHGPCRQWHGDHFDQWAGYVGNSPSSTYIVPVAP